MNLVNVKWMNLVSCVRDTPMSTGSYLYPNHWLIIWGELAVVDVETLLILGKLHRKIRRAPLQLI